MNIAELLYNIVMEDGSPEAWEIASVIPQDNRENIAKLWNAGFENNIPNANSLTRLQAIVDGLKAGKYAFDSETGEPMDIIPKDDKRPLQVDENGQIHVGNEPKQDDHFGEEQIDELKNLFAALKDDPGDNRWED